MKKILFINILALILGAIQLNGQCSDFVVFSNSTDETCVGANDGTAIATAAAGTLPYFYIWSSGGTTAEVTGLSAGSYTVTVTDVNGCVAVSIVQVTLSSEGIWLMPSSTPVSCFGGNDGTAYPGVMSGTAPYTYTWDDPNNQTTETAVGLTAGQYNVTVTDVNGCSNSTPVTVGSPPELVNVITNTTNIVCLTDTNGSITASGFGGTGNITYTWSNGASGSTISGLPLGTYTVTATDANGCTAVTFSKVGLISPVVSAYTSGTNVLCNGANDGTATVHASSGLPPYMYLWSNGQTGATATGLAPGTYDVTVTDANGCTWVSTVGSSSVTINQPLGITISETNITNIACHGESTGSISINAFGGTGTLSYEWSNGSSTGSSISGLAAGTYTGTITDDNGCTTITTATVTEPAPLTAIGSSTAVTTPNGSDGTATVTANGGTSPYTYLWSNGATTPTISGLTGGTYTVTITDANGCTTTTTVTVMTPMVPAITLVITNTSTNCSDGSDGSATVTASGGMTPYTYLWSNGQTGATATGLGPGTYTVTVTDAQGNSETISTTVGSNSSAISISTTPTNIDCTGNMNGAVNTSVTGGNAGYTYAWSNGSTSSDLSGLGAGTYTLTVTDDNGCTSIQEVTITEPSPITASGIGTNPSTSGGADGSIDLTVSGGTPGYTFLWSNGGTMQTIAGVGAGTYTVTITDANGTTATSSTTVATASNPTVTGTGSIVNCGLTNGTASSTPSGGTPGYTYSWSNGETTQNISGLGIGMYTVTITDTNGCTATTTVEVAAGNAPPVIVMTTGTDPNTPGGMNGFITANVSSGTSPYTYLWSNGETTQTITGLVAGCYTVTVTDSNGCTATSESCIIDPVPIVVNTTSTPSNECSGTSTGTATAVVTSGVSPYTYLWSNGETTETITGLSPGTYTVTVTDDAGSMVSSTIVVGAEPLPTVVGTGSSIDCGITDGTASANAAGGTPGYTYEWSTGATTQNISNLGAGVYTVTATDANGCTATTTVNVIENSPAVTVTAMGTNPNIPGGMNGFVTANVGGGSPGFTYLWSTGETTQTINGLGAGCYTVTVTDANNCTAESEACLVDPPLITVSVSTTSSIECNGNNDGTATVTPTSGTSPYTYLWSTGDDTATATNLTPGTYTVTVTDANGAMAVETVTVGSISNPTASGTGSNINCGITDGTATATGSGGTPLSGGGYNYAWSNGETTQNLSGLSAGMYTVTVTDANGCTATTEVSVIENSPPASVITTGTNMSAPGANDGSITATPSGTAPFTYSWSNGATTQTINNLSPGCYTVTITDAAGCTAESTTCIPEITILTVTVTTTLSIECNGDNDGTATVTPTSGTSPYTYLWSTGDDTATASNLIPGTYTVTVTDVTGAMAIETVTVGSISNPTASGTGSNINCGITDGTATATGSGGVPLSGGGYNYAWSNGETTQNLSGLSAGIYTVTVTDANGCTAITEVIVIEDAPPASVTTAGTNMTAPGANDGSITATPSGTAPFTYLWSNGATTQTIDNLSPGCYTVTVTDAAGCTAESTTCIPEIEILAVTLTTTSSIECNGNNDGTVTATPTSGTPDYIYLWSTGDDTQTVDNLMPGDYIVTVIDANGAMAIDTVTVGSVSNPIAVATATDISCNGQGDGTLEASATGGTADYTYLWNTPNNDNTSFVNGQGTGIYTVTVTDANGCTDVATIEIEEEDPIDALQAVNPIECDGTPASITMMPSGGTTPYSYEWSTAPTDTLATLGGLSAGVYTVTITDDNECTATQEIVIDESPSIEIQIEEDTTISCDGNSTINVTVLTTVDSIIWTDANGTVIGMGNDYSILGAEGSNLIYATAYSNNGCTGTDSTILFVPEPIELTLSPQDTMVECEATMLNLSATNPNVISYTWYDDSALSSQIGTGSDLPAFMSTAPQYYYVEAMDAYGCVEVDSVFAGHTTLISAIAGELDVCSGDSLTVASMPSSNDENAELTYTWTDPNGAMVGMDSILTLADPVGGQYTVEITDQYGCMEMFPTSVNLFDLVPLLTATADEDTILKGMESQLLVLPDEDGYTYEWSNTNTIVSGEATDNNIMVAPTETTDYGVLVTHPNGCSALTNVLVTVIDPTCDEPFIFFPNAFSPNDDNVNDVLYLRGFSVDESYFMIFNRWGQKVFESNSQEEGWDGTFNGKKVCNDVYGYYLRVTCTNGEEYIKKGNVTVFN